MKKYKNKFINETKNEALFIKTNNGQQKNGDFKNFMETVIKFVVYDVTIH